VTDGTVLDGELVIFVEGRLRFDALQQRMTADVRRAADLARVQPASVIIFDVLRHDGEDLTSRPWRERRSRLEQLADGWRPPLQITPYTADRQEAVGWMDALAPMGIEGIVSKRSTSTYRPGADWIKVRYRETLVGVIGAVIGSLAAPEALMIGRIDSSGELVIVGRTVALSPSQSTAIGRLLRPPASAHPWPAVIGSGHFGGPVAITPVEPEIIAEVSADPAEQAGRRRHLLRFVRLRLD
jgi:ATP-dependent DNA ligase